jgi:hypothetical protein
MPNTALLVANPEKERLLISYPDWLTTLLKLCKDASLAQIKYKSTSNLWLYKPIGLITLLLESIE